MDYTKYKEAKEGEKEETKVSKIEEGTGADFYTDGYFAKFENQEDVARTKVQGAMRITCENGANLVIMLPTGSIISPRSNLALWKRTYGGYPEQGQPVRTKADGNGFQRIILEK